MGILKGIVFPLIIVGFGVGIFMSPRLMEGTDEPMKSNDISGYGAIICTHCAKEGLPILRATRDTSLEDVDSGWQFTCGVNSHGIEDAQLWRVDEILQHDRTIEPIIGSAASSSFTRSDAGSAWRKQKYGNEN